MVSEVNLKNVEKWLGWIALFTLSIALNTCGACHFGHKCGCECPAEPTQERSSP